MNSGEKQSITLHYDVPKEGKYWMVIGMCDPDTQNLMINGTAVVVSPYGHLPARMYGILPFTKFILFAYTIITVVWLGVCCVHRKELMSVHVMITVVSITFLFDTIIKLISLLDYNAEGTYTPGITIFSLITTATTHTVARCLCVMVAKGLGVTTTELKGIWKIILMGAVYFCFSLWDSIATTFATVTQVNLWRIIPASALDSLIYFWILQSLLDTIQDLQDKKQEGKLSVFNSLRNMIIVAVILSTVYNVAFSYLIMEKKVDSLWKYQWFFNEGVWTSFYLVVIVVIMVG